MLDHLLAIAFGLGFPALNTPVYARRRPALRANDSAVRHREYLETIAWLGCMGLATVIVWRIADREWAILGLGFEASWSTGAALVFSATAVLFLALQVREARRDPAARKAAREALEPVREYLPTSREEARLFHGVSVAAGLGEEIFYRGFLIWYLAQAMPLALAVALSSLAFGLAHVMHGAQATVRATVMGLVLAGLYVWSGSLWASMLLHTAVDVTSGETGVATFGGPDQGSRASPVALLPVTASGLSLLRAWLDRTHVAEWWGDPDEAFAFVAGHSANAHALISCDGRPVGYVCWQHLTDDERAAAGLGELPEDHVDVDLLIGEADALGRGVAPQALGLLIEQLEGEGVSSVGLAAAEANEPARRAYRSAGFDLHRRFTEEGRPMLYLVRSLAGSV